MRFFMKFNEETSEDIFKKEARIFGLDKRKIELKIKKPKTSFIIFFF